MNKRIGIDATSLPPKPGGAANYIIHLIREITALPGDENWLVITHRNGVKTLNIPNDDRVKLITIPNYSSATRLVWEQTILPSIVHHEQIDLLHSPHYTRPLFLRSQSVVTFHDMTFFLYPHLHTRIKRFFFPAAMRLSSKLADSLVAVSENTRQDAIRILRIPSEKIKTTALGVDSEFHPISNEKFINEIKQRYNLPEEFILYIATVEPRKNLALLLRSYARIISKDQNFLPLVVVGQFGWNYQEVLKYVEDNHLEKVVHFTGYIPVEDLPGVYNAASIFCYPTLYEGFGLPPLEAMACGIPVITSAVSSLPEHVGKAGVLLPPGDEHALSQALMDLAHDDEKREYYSRQGPIQASNFTWKKTAQLTLQIYRDTLTG